MNTIDDYIIQVTDYLKSITGDEVSVTRMNDNPLLSCLPLTVTRQFVLYKLTILSHEVILARIDDGDSISPSRLKNLLSLIESSFGMTVVLGAKTMASYHSRRLVSARVNFLVPGKLLFMPSLLTHLADYKVVNNKLSDRMPPMAQCILLYHLQVSNIAGNDCGTLSELFHVSYATMNRALRWLVKNQLISVEGSKTRRVVLNGTKKQLWERALPMMRSPVEALWYTDQNLNNAMEAGVNALSHYTMINPQSNKMFAVSADEIKSLKVELDKVNGENVIQVWRYDPHLLSNGAVVDSLSLYLSLVDDQDERVQIELEKMMSELPWYMD